MKRSTTDAEARNDEAEESAGAAAEETEKEDNHQEKCTICLSEFEEDEDVR